MNSASRAWWLMKRRALWTRHPLLQGYCKTRMAVVRVELPNCSGLGWTAHLSMDELTATWIRNDTKQLSLCRARHTCHGP